MVSNLVSHRCHYEFKPHLTPVRRGLRGKITHGSVHLLCADRAEASWWQPGQAWLISSVPQGCSPSAHSLGSQSHGHSRDSSQARVMGFLPQGLGVEASG